eukprot:4082818-Pleurochrysis_carterae.AAC.3
MTAYESACKHVYVQPHARKTTCKHANNHACVHNRTHVFFTLALLTIMHARARERTCCAGLGKATKQPSAKKLRTRGKRQKQWCAQREVNELHQEQRKGIAITFLRYCTGTVKKVFAAILELHKGDGGNLRFSLRTVAADGGNLHKGDRNLTVAAEMGIRVKRR